VSFNPDPSPSFCSHLKLRDPSAVKPRPSSPRSRAEPAPSAPPPSSESSSAGRSGRHRSCSRRQGSGVGGGRGGGAPAPPSVRAGQAAMDTTTFFVALLAWGGCQIEVAVLSSSRLRLDPSGRRPLLAWIRAPIWRGRAGDASRPALPYRSRDCVPAVPVAPLEEGRGGPNRSLCCRPPDPKLVPGGCTRPCCPAPAPRGVTVYRRFCF
jgi:hypothetical protein